MKLDKIKEVIDKINEVNKDIELLDKQAKLCASGDNKVELYLNFTDLVLKAKEDKKSVLGEDGSLDNNHMAMGLFTWKDGRIQVNNQTNSYETEYATELSDSFSLEILGIIIARKKEIKDKLIRKLSRMGVKLN